MGGQCVGVGRVHGGLFAFSEGMCVFVHGCVCVCVCVCVCRVGAGTGKCVWVWGLRYCIGGVGVALLPVSYKNGKKFARISHEIRTKFVRISYELRANFVRNSSPKCTVNVIVTNFVRNSHEFRTNFVRISTNLHEFVSFLCRTNTLSP